MDKSIKKRARHPSPSAAVVLANWFQFGAGARLVQPCVESRMLLWCRKGHGTVTVNGEKHNLSPGDWLFLPWNRRLAYHADSQDPFLVGGIHLIPDCQTRPIRFQVAHSSASPLANLPTRRDADLPGLRGLIAGRFEGTDRLELLATYVVERHQSDLQDEASARGLARLLIAEVQAAAKPGGTRPMPGSLRRLQEFLRKHLPENTSLEFMALRAGVSIAGLHRLFRAYLGSSPGKYLAQLRVEKAAELLRTTTLPIHEVGLQVGLPDPFHFSRFFKRKMGLSPRSYQKGRRVL